MKNNESLEEEDAINGLAEEVTVGGEGLDEGGVDGGGECGYGCVVGG